MKNFIVYNKNHRILRTGKCQDRTFRRQAKDGEFVIEGKANDATQKIVAGKIVNKTRKEIETDNPTPKPIPFKKQPALITNAQWQAVLGRLSKLETKS